MRFAMFPLHLSKVLRLPRKSDSMSYVIRSAAPVTQNHLSKPEDLRLQNGTPLRKSTPGPPNSSDEDVSCTAPAACYGKCIFADPLQMPHACHRFWKCYKIPTFCSLLLLTRCTIPLACHGKATSEPPKVVRTCGVFNVLTWKCASRYNGVHFFNISTSKSGPRPSASNTFDLEMYFGFSEPTFRPCGATSHWKNTVNRDLFYLFAHLHLLSSDSFSWLFLFSDLLSSSLIFSLLLFSSLTLPTSAFPSIGSLTSKLPSAIYIYMYVTFICIYIYVYVCMYIYIYAIEIDPLHHSILQNLPHPSWRKRRWTAAAGSCRVCCTVSAHLPWDVGSMMDVCITDMGWNSSWMSWIWVYKPIKRIDAGDLRWE